MNVVAVRCEESQIQVFDVQVCESLAEAATSPPSSLLWDICPSKAGGREFVLDVLLYTVRHRVELGIASCARPVEPLPPRDERIRSKALVLLRIVLQQKPTEVHSSLHNAAGNNLVNLGLLRLASVKEPAKKLGHPHE